MSSDLLTVPIFPLPSFVAFPRQSHHFHIFEPRYREMIQECLDEDGELGVALAIKKLSDPDPAPNLESRLATNQATYEPAHMFCVGHVTLIETLNDGRMLIQVDVQRKVKLLDIVQTIPYYVAVVETIHEPLGDPKEAAILYELLKNSAKKLLKDKFVISKSFFGGRAEQLPELVTEILRLVHFDPALAQIFLEQSSIVDRARAIHRILLEANRQLDPPTQEEPKKIDRRVDGNVIHVNFQDRATLH